MKKISIAFMLTMACLMMGTMAYADITVSTTTKVYEVPLKYIDNYDAMVKEGKLVSVKTTASKSKEVFKNKDTVIIFPTEDKYKNINLAINLLKAYAKKLDNVDIKKFNRIIDMLMVEQPQSAKVNQGE